MFGIQIKCLAVKFKMKMFFPFFLGGGPDVSKMLAIKEGPNKTIISQTWWGECDGLWQLNSLRI